MTSTGFTAYKNGKFVPLKTGDVVGGVQFEIIDVNQKLEQMKISSEKEIVVGKPLTSTKQLTLNERFVPMNTKRVLKSIHEIVSSNPNEKMTEAQIKEEASKRDRKNRLYASKLKLSVRLYSNLNEKLLEEINTLKNLYATSQKNIETYKVTKEEIHELETNVKRYDGEVIKLEKKYPWLLNSELKLTVIEALAVKLQSLRQQHNDLQSQLDVFKGLSPDLNEARHQLAMAKKSYDQMRGTNQKN